MKAYLPVLGLGLLATGASAQNSGGTLDLSGSVSARCAAVTETAPMVLGELAAQDGRVNRTFSDATELIRGYSVICTNSNPRIGVEARPLAANLSDADGYTGIVHYTVRVSAQESGGASEVFTHTTNGAAPVLRSLAGRLANSENNIVVDVSNGFTERDERLLAGAYHASVTIIISASN